MTENTPYLSLEEEWNCHQNTTVEFAYVTYGMVKIPTPISGDILAQLRHTYKG